METKLERIAEISANTRKPKFTSLYHHINEEMLKQCHKELDENKDLGIAAYEDKFVQLAIKKILEAIYEPRFLDNMYGFRPKRGCHNAIKTAHDRIYQDKINYIVDADIKGFFGAPG